MVPSEPVDIKQLITKLDSKDLFIRGQVVDELVKIGAPAVEPLIRALRDESPVVKAYALEALKEITGENLGQEPFEWERWWEENGEYFLKRHAESGEKE